MCFVVPALRRLVSPVNQVFVLLFNFQFFYISNEVYKASGECIVGIMQRKCVCLFETELCCPEILPLISSRIVINFGSAAAIRPAG
jgi:hypothetical protein